LSTTASRTASSEIRAGLEESDSYAREFFSSLKSLCVSLAPVKDRKAIFVFTEDFHMLPSVQTEFGSLVSEARRSNVSFITVDARGSRNPAIAPASTLPTDPETGRPITQGSEDLHIDPIANLQLSRSPGVGDVLRSLADSTGGVPIYNTDSFVEELGRIDLELSNYYILGFKAASRPGEARVHKIEVKLDVKKSKLKHRETVHY
jgi:VWFA-related protein